jgi:hypothetical protein
MLRGFFRTTRRKERDSMRGWFLFAIIVFLVFGIPLIDELYRLRVRRATNRARPIVHGPISLVPGDDEQDLLRSPNVASIAKAKEYAA